MPCFLPLAALSVNSKSFNNVAKKLQVCVPICVSVIKSIWFVPNESFFKLYFLDWNCVAVKNSDAPIFLASLPTDEPQGHGIMTKFITKTLTHMKSRPHSHMHRKLGDLLKRQHKQTQCAHGRAYASTH